MRSISALSGGLLQEIGAVALPGSVRRTTLYRTMVEVALRFLVEDLGQVEGVYPGQGRLVEKFLLKRTASHGIELLGLVAFHASPIWVLAALADATGSGRKLMGELSDALKEEGLLDENVRFENVDQLLAGLESTSRYLAETLNLPPVDIKGLRRDWDQLRKELAQIPPKRLPAIDRIEQIWSDLRALSQQQDSSVFAISSVLAVSAISHVPATVLWLSRAAKSSVRRTGKVLGDAVLTHYTEAIGEIRATGFAAYWAREFKPYLRAAVEHFSPERLSATERLLSRLYQRA